MRALMVPQVLTWELLAESDFYSYRLLRDLLTERQPSFYVWARGRDEGLPQLWPNMELFTEGAVEWSFSQQMVATTGRLFELFNRISGLYPVDAVFTSRAGLVPALMVGLATTPNHPVPCVTMEPRVYAPNTPAHNTVTEIDAGARALGYAMGLGVYWSTWERDEAMRCVELWLSPAALKQAEEHAFVIPYLVNVPSEPARSETRAGEQKRLLFVGRLNTNKRYKDILDAYAKVLASRTDVEVWVHSGTGAYKHLERNNSRWHRTSERFPLMEQYYGLLAGGHVGAYASFDEGINVSNLEMLAHGIVMALPQRPWVEKVFHPLTYPFGFKSMKELPPLLDYLLDNYDECFQKLAGIRQMIRTKHGPDAWRAGWDPLLAAVAEQNERNAIDPLYQFRDAVKVLLERQPRVSLRTALDVALQAFQTHPWRRQFVFSNYAAYLGVRDYDDYSDAVPQLVRG